MFNHTNVTMLTMWTSISWFKFLSIIVTKNHTTFSVASILTTVCLIVAQTFLINNKQMIYLVRVYSQYACANTNNFIRIAISEIEIRIEIRYATIGGFPFKRI